LFLLLASYVFKGSQESIYVMPGLPFLPFLLSGSVSYLRLDGSVEASKRFDVVKKFNADPTIDVLLLTTHG